MSTNIKYKAPTRRGQILLDAALNVSGKRMQDYGKTENNFQMIANLWTVYTGHKITTHDVAMMMCLLNIARIKNGGGSGGCYVDLAGYAACAGEVIMEGKNDGN